MTQFLTWWLWRRWRIYCPRGSVAHLFDQCGSLLDYDESFVPPCTLNEVNRGRFKGTWTQMISLIGMTVNDEP